MSGCLSAISNQATQSDRQNIGATKNAGNLLPALFWTPGALEAF